MLVNNPYSKRKLSLIGMGWNIGEIDIEVITRHSCTGAVLDEENFEWEEGNLKFINRYLSFSNSMILVLKNLNNNQEKIFEFKNLKNLGIYRGKLNPEDLVLTNSFLKIPKAKYINHWDYEDEQYYIELVESWNGIYGECYFAEGEEFDYKKLKISPIKVDTGNEYYEWVCQVKYLDKLNEYKSNKIIKRKKILKVR
tara:strand:+ start:1593 stop:2183 length:591 start_codon:yes stop_codon:yes gene_type:complete